jgi:hypothetical protein
MTSRPDEFAIQGLRGCAHLRLSRGRMADLLFASNDTHFGHQNRGNQRRSGALVVPRTHAEKSRSRTLYLPDTIVPCSIFRSRRKRGTALKGKEKLAEGWGHKPSMQYRDSMTQSDVYLRGGPMSIAGLGRASVNALTTSANFPICRCRGAEGIGQDVGSGLDGFALGRFAF